MARRSLEDGDWPWSGDASPNTAEASRPTPPPDLLNAIWPRCWCRIRRWSIPPRRSPDDWRRVARSEGTVAAYQAWRDYDPSRDVPWDPFLHGRVIAAIAADLGISQQAVSNRKRSALRRLRLAIEKNPALTGFSWL